MSGQIAAAALGTEIELGRLGASRFGRTICRLSNIWNCVVGKSERKHTLRACVGAEHRAGGEPGRLSAAPKEAAHSP